MIGISFQGCPGDEIEVENRPDDSAAVDGRPCRQVIGGDNRYPRPAAFRMTDGELQGGPSAGRYTNNDHLVDAKTVEELGIGIGLRRGRKVAGQGRTKIAKRDGAIEPTSAPGQCAGHIDALIKAAAGSRGRSAPARPHPSRRIPTCRTTSLSSCYGRRGGAHAPVRSLAKDCVDTGGGNNKE